MTDHTAEIERALEAALSRTQVPGAPPRLAAALQYAVFPGGARVRPRLCLAVASSCGGKDLRAAMAAATAIELLHCASLAHDDLPCFDDADTRRGKPSLHRAFGEPIAVLAGDALIVLAFETLTLALERSPLLLVPLMLTVNRAVGAPYGIAAGQAWESEPNVPLETYQRAKTSALFVAATMTGAIAGGGDPTQWRELGDLLGQAYQVADDVSDAAASASALGKPIGRDIALGRPSSASDRGVSGAIDHLKHLIASAIAVIPPCEGAAELKALVQAQATRILPIETVRHAAAARVIDKVAQATASAL